VVYDRPFLGIRRKLSRVPENGGHRPVLNRKRWRHALLPPGEATVLKVKGSS
jgi:hypothetical protein